MKNKLFLCLLALGLLLGLQGCWPRPYPGPLILNLKNSWELVKTIQTKTGKEVVPTGTQTLIIEQNEDERFMEILKFYRDSVPYDSLFMPSADNYRSSMSGREKNETIVKYIDGNGEPAIVRFLFFFQRGRARASSMQVNIQKNTSVYNPAADTLVMEYRAMF